MQGLVWIAEGRCACGCGGTTQATFTTGCDKELVVAIARNEPELLARVDWRRIGTDFYNGQLSRQVEWHLRYQEQLRKSIGKTAE